MALDWDNVVRHLDNYPPGIHRLLPPCTEEQLLEVQSKLGRLPDGIFEMLRHFNGGKLFTKTGPLVSIFRLSPIPSLPRFEWAEGYCIDQYTPRWRAAGPDRQNDWAVAMMSYAVLVIVCGDGRVGEWDTAQGIWEPRNFNNFDDWVQEILREGDASLKEE